MVAEGYNASRCIHKTNERVKTNLSIADTVYEILWKGLRADQGFKKIEEILL
jgi:glycerol-3-phosphate dehydrogenase (NAD(P)+)